MRKIIILIGFVAIAATSYGQYTSWPQVRKKQNFQDSVRFADPVTFVSPVTFNDSIAAGSFLPLLVDTIPLASFGLGTLQTADTALINDNAYIGSFYNDGSDTLVITKLACGLGSGTGTETIVVNIVWSDTLGAVVPTKLNTSGYTVTAVIPTVGDKDTAFDNTKVAPGKWVWGYLSGTSAGNRPSFVTATISGYKISTY